MPVPDQAEEQVYYQLLKLAGKSMLERIGEVEQGGANIGPTSSSGSTRSRRPSPR